MGWPILGKPHHMGWPRWVYSSRSHIHTQSAATVSKLPKLLGLFWMSPICECVCLCVTSMSSSKSQIWCNCNHWALKIARSLLKKSPQCVCVCVCVCVWPRWVLIQELFSKKPYVLSKELHSIKRAMYSIKRVPYWIRRALYWMKREQNAIERVLYI